ncbi:hypothetical protein D9M73_51830 [compost metagenome]
MYMQWVAMGQDSIELQWLFPVFVRKNGNQTMMKKTAQQIYDQAFAPGRSLRSEAYKRGVMDCLRVSVDGLLREECPYTIGTAEADAWFSGQAEGNALARWERTNAIPVGKRQTFYISNEGISTKHPRQPN